MQENVFHYTSYQALLGIIQKNEIIFHGSRHDCMNDPNDCMFARNIVLPAILANLEHSKFTEKEKEVIESFPYVVSFSEKEDDKFMWEHYGSQVCLVLSSDEIKRECDTSREHLGIWGKCRYAENDDVPKIFSKIFNTKPQSDKIVDNVMEACSFIKRKAFQIEKEWRLVANDYNTFYLQPDGKCVDAEIPDKNTKFKSDIKGYIMPYKEFRIAPSALKGIIVNEDNPSDFFRIKHHIELLLIKNGFTSDIKIKQTNKYPF